MSREKEQRIDGTTGAATRRSAFTLIELLAVIVVIALLASLIVPLTALAVKNMKVARVETELKDIETAIKDYKATKGFYPPDNPNSFVTNQLLYELNGSIYDSTNKTYSPTYNRLLALKAVDITGFFGAGVEGFVNTTQNPSEVPIFIHNFTSKQGADYFYTAGNVTFKLLVCTVHNADGNLVPWNYNSSNPTNSPASFDLWVDLVIRGKTNRFCNWSSTPIIL